ncbi:hypothetical protein LSAT2_031839 [Lamellibrachia satsuma]|nr:hypothetical protein LSAT2_031839 [Lamellibrachia satsuma]
MSLPVLFSLKVFLLGDMSGGKSSLMKSLIDGCPSTVTVPTEGVVSQLWQPLLSEANKDLVDRKLSTQETHLLLDLWDMSGRPVCQGIHQMFLTPSALHVIVFNIADDHGCEGVINYVRTIQTKVPGSVIMLVGTHRDHLHTDIDWHKKGEEVATCIGMTERNWKENIQKEIDIVK